MIAPNYSDYIGTETITGGLKPIELPKVTWSMTMGDFTMDHTTPYSRWKAFWLRFMGWKVTKGQ